MNSIFPGGRPPGDPPNGGRPPPIPPGGPRRRTRGAARPVRGIYIWLALLTFLAVFAATAGARETLASRTQAVRQTVAATLPTTRTITVSAAWHDVQSVIAMVNNTGDPTTIVPRPQSTRSPHRCTPPSTAPR